MSDICGRRSDDLVRCGIASLSTTTTAPSVPQMGSLHFSGRPSHCFAGRGSLFLDHWGNEPTEVSVAFSRRYDCCIKEREAETSTAKGALSIGAHRYLQAEAHENPQPPAPTFSVADDTEMIGLSCKKSTRRARGWCESGLHGPRAQSREGHCSTVQEPRRRSVVGCSDHRMAYALHCSRSTPSLGFGPRRGQWSAPSTPSARSPARPVSRCAARRTAGPPQGADGTSGRSNE